MSSKTHSPEMSQLMANAEQHTLRKTPFRIYTTPFSDILAHRYSGSGTKQDPYLVEWLPNDAEDPQMWSSLYKWLQTIQVAIATLSVALASSAYSGALDSLQARFHPEKQIILTLGVSLFVLGFAFGPLFWAPFSEVVGRRNLFIFTYAIFTLWQAVSIASPNIESLLVFRFLSGFFGSSPLVNTGGTLADMFNAKQRGLAMAIFASAPFLGPALGPITGGFLGETSGWQWVIGFLAIFAGVITLIGAISLPETYAPVLLRWRAQKLQELTGDEYICKLDKGRDLRLSTQFKVALGRPWLLLIYEPIVSLLSVYIAIIYGVLYSLFGAFPIVFQRYRGWSPGIGGLAFLGVLVGMIFALAYIILFENPRYGRICDKNGGIAPPEARLPPAMIGAVSVVVGLAIFAATDSPDLPWIAPIIGGGPFGMGMVLIFLACMNYLTDSYLIYAASVLASNSVIRSLFGFAFPLFTSNLYSIGGKNGIHWGPAIAGLLALICLPFPFIFYKYGAGIRERCKYASEAKRMLENMQASSKKQQPRPASDNDDDLEKAQIHGSDMHNVEATRTNSHMGDAKLNQHLGAARNSMDVEASTQAHTPHHGSISASSNSSDGMEHQ
ncbi:putative mfs-multidrug-resistance transporter [Mycosarcoma maydis]|uniref:Mfs-multidrug-resistance transporter n=1 Tax=Mycosarcoma maydis TaxID=5270 RepID=A0A0D1E820_MYCMD|nr:putative mfs-multidrug-resistance transporter [Ustilago maydis 521]KIS71591.1 putative mfs-multidrug-resistance transporter [Ustilago maydis 521]|eukprot:XP_011386010.1 putative mfs-multidrug-resistance transporter [Ustilago maydis 521]